jgi:hypothetical protein
MVEIARIFAVIAYLCRGPHRRTAPKSREWKSLRSAGDSHPRPTVAREAVDDEYELSWGFQVVFGAVGQRVAVYI